MKIEMLECVFFFYTIAFFGTNRKDKKEKKLEKKSSLNSKPHKTYRMEPPRDEPSGQNSNYEVHDFTHINIFTFIRFHFL
jgi:hypothetical protein